MTQKEQPTGQFSDLGIGKDILASLSQKGFKVATPIQHQVIPSALKGKDVVGIAQTGTGKTLAFGIPMIQRILSDRGQGLILVPTRELALQVDQSLRNVGASLGLKTAVVIGGVSPHFQVKALRNRPHIVVATPGRLADLINQRKYSLGHVSIVTLDEADRMLDIGFLPQIKKILENSPKGRQTMLFSATMPKSISLLASEFMKMPLRIEIAPQGTSAENIEQEVLVVKKNDKTRLLDSILEQYGEDRTLVFSRTKYGASRIARDIRNMGHTATEIHSNRSQSQRKKSLEGFKNGRFRIMVATDIAARGIDVKEISLVINFDLPSNSEDYVHRIGRTGRAGCYGRAISFVAPSEKAGIRKIEKLIQQSLPILSLPTLPPEREKVFAREESRETNYSRSGGHNRRRSGGGNRGRVKSSSANGRGRPQQRSRSTSGGRQNNFRGRR